MDITNLEGNNFKIKSKLASISTSPFQIGEKIIYGAGEYEISGVSVMCWRDASKNLVYLIEADKLNIVFLGDFTGKLDSNLIDELGSVDVVLTSSKDGFTESLRLEPFYIVSTQEDVVKEAGYTPEVTPKFSIKKEDILEEANTKVVVLERK